MQREARALKVSGNLAEWREGVAALVTRREARLT
jgi:hypothetical protein